MPLSQKKSRSFAAMTPEQHRELASRGGRTTQQRGKAYRFTPEKAREAGREGGKRISQNREHMAAIGRQGGRTTSQKREHMAAIGRQGGLKGKATAAPRADSECQPGKASAFNAQAGGRVRLGEGE